MISTTRLLFAFLLTPSIAAAVTIETVPIGHAGNAGDSHSAGVFGSVRYRYRMGKTEITNAQYVEFLNAVADADPNGLWSTSMHPSLGGAIDRIGSPGTYTYSVRPGNIYPYANKPVVFVSWYDTLRFVNWLHNGQPKGPQDSTTTEDGSYTFSAPTTVSARKSNATWVLPNEDEWHKAAFYDGVAGIYYDYPTGTDIPPDNNFPTTDSGNSANFFDGEHANPMDSDYTTGDPDRPLTDVGAYLLSPSPYGTFDQGGNVWEWNEESLFGTNNRRIRGGDWFLTVNHLASSNRTASGASNNHYSIGFRVAFVPEPTSVMVLIFVAAALWIASGRMKKPRRVVTPRFP
jgi:formylglycine-generating enzyme required for sulfatase activity